MKKHLQRILSLLCVMALVFTVVGALAEETESRIIMVLWDDGNNFDGIRPAAVNASLGGQSVSLSDANGWTAEVSVPKGTEAAWECDPVLSYAASSSVTGIITTVTYRHDAHDETDTVTASVKWDDQENAKKLRPESVKVMLYADGVACGEPKVVQPSDWTVQWKDMPRFKPNDSTPVTYTVKQLQDPAGYTAAASGLTVTNTLNTVSLTVDISLSGAEGIDAGGLKVTLDGPDPSMPQTLGVGSVTLSGLLPGAYLIRDNNADSLAPDYTMDKAQSKVNDAKYIESGSDTLTFRYIYKEPAPYKEEEGYNEADMESYDPTANTANLTFEILGPSHAPDYTLPKTVTYAEFVNGQYTLDNLVPGVYTVVERNAETLVKYYTLTSDSLTAMKLEVKAGGTATASLYNKYVPAPTPEPDAEFVDIPVTKTWNDWNNLDGSRPTTITVRLYADGVEVAEHALTEEGNWSYTFAQMPRYQDDMKTEIVYTVDEDVVDGYTKDINGYNLVNSHTPDVTTLAVSKVWNDNNNEQGLRPTTIVMTLYQNGAPYTYVTLSAANNWAAEVNNVPVSKNGIDYTYSWSEQEVLNYTQQQVVQTGNTMVFHNAVWERPPQPNRGGTPKTPGKPTETLTDYETPLGVDVIINHVGDCYD